MHVHVHVHACGASDRSTCLPRPARCPCTDLPCMQPPRSAQAASSLMQAAPRPASHGGAMHPADRGLWLCPNKPWGLRTLPLINSAPAAAVSLFLLPPHIHTHSIHTLYLCMSEYSEPMGLPCPDEMMSELCCCPCVFSTPSPCCLHTCIQYIHSMSDHLADLACPEIDDE